MSGLTDGLPNRVELRVTAMDEDYSMVTLSAADGRFAGAIELYGADRIAADMAIALEGFPLSPADVREFTLGSRDERVAGGWIDFTCRCVDLAGHPVIEVELCDKGAIFGRGQRTAEVHLRVEAPTIDSFVLALRSWRIALGSSVTLLGAP